MRHRHTSGGSAACQRPPAPRSFARLRRSYIGTAALLWLLGAAAVLAADADASWDVTAARGRTREVDFDTQEGTWMSMDLSPDGRWVVFDLLAQVYRVAVQGGKAQCLTEGSGLALNFQPRYSPDGKTIAFISDRKGQNNLWLMDADGSNPRPVTLDPVARAYEPAWTPDSRFIAVRRETTGPGYAGKSALWLYGRDGGEGMELVGSAVPEAGWPSISADGRSLYYHYSATGASDLEDRDAVRGAFQIQRLDLHDGRVQDITSGNAQRMYQGSGGGAIAPEVSPDGRWLAFARRIPDGTFSYKGHQLGPRTALWLRDLQTGAERVLSDPIEQDMSEGMKTWRVLPGYSWAHDSKSLVISRGGHIHRVWLDGRTEMIPFTAHVHRTLSEMAYANRPASGESFEARALRWYTPSPDGKRIAFQAVGHVWVMDLPAGTPHRLTPAEFPRFEYSPSWSPDGRWIAFTTWDERAGGELWKAASGGGRPRQLTVRAGEYINPSWSPEGTELLLAQGSGATLRGRSWANNAWYDIVRVPAGGGPAVKVTRTDRPGGPLSELVMQRELPEPAVGPEGRIYFAEYAPSKIEGVFFETHLVSVRRDGSERRTHLIFPVATQFAISPDGRWIAYEESDNLYLAPFPGFGTGGTPLLLDRARPAVAVQALSTQGGNFPHWLDADTLTFGSAKRFFVHHLGSGKTDSAEVHLRVPRDLPHGTLALVGARIVTLNHRQVIEEGTLVINNERIVCLGNCDTSHVDKRIDAHGKTLIPGFIDMHAHHYREYHGITPAHDFEHAAYLAYGVTTTFDPSSWYQNVFPIAELTEAGGMIGPRTFSTGDPLNRGNEARWTEITDYATAEHEVTRARSYGAIAVKQYLQPRREQRQWLVEVARKQGLTVTSEGDSLEYNIGTTLDGQTGWEHALSYAPLYGDAATFFGKAGVAYDPTIIVGGAGPWNEEFLLAQSDLWKDKKLARWTPWLELLPHMRRRTLRPDTDYSYPFIAQGLADIIAAGGHGAIGAHGQEHGIGSQWEVWLEASALGPMGALEVASQGGAWFLGMQQDLGSLEVGKLADLIVLNANPLENIRNTADMQFVMKGGRLYEATTLDQVWPLAQAFGEPYWTDTDASRADVRPLRP